MAASLARAADMGTRGAMWLHRRVSDDVGRQINAFERSFRRAGLPNMIVGYSATEDIFTRAIPFLTVVFMAQVVNALDVEANWWMNLLFFLGGVGVMLGAFGLLNVARGRPFASIPRRLGAPELAAFVVLPGLLPIIFNGQWRFGITTMLVNLALLGVVYAVVGYGVFSIVGWAVGRLFTQLRLALPLLVRAVPLLLFFSLVSFLATETWQVFTEPAPGRYWTVIGLFVLLGSTFLIVQIPHAVREVEEDVGTAAEPLRRRERINLAVVVFISESLQVLLVSAAVWLFYVVIGSLLVPASVRAVWLLEPTRALITIPFPGNDVTVTSELLRVSTGVAAFAGLYYAVGMLVDRNYRDLFIDQLTEELRDTFTARSAYLRAVRERDAAVTAADAAFTPGGSS